MRTISKARIFVNVLLVLVFVVGLGFLSNRVQAQDSGGVTSAGESGLSVAATKPWTSAEMKAAIPYPLGDLDAAEAYAMVDATAYGAPANVAGAKPGMSPLANAMSDGIDILTTGGYSYPPPFTRQYVYQISAETKYPFLTIGKIFFHQHNADYPGGANFVCSGSAIALNGIATAGHCLHAGNNSAGGWSTNVVFVPAYKNGVAPLGQWTIVYATETVMTDWYATGNPGVDFGVAKVYKLGGYSLGTRTGYLGYTSNQPRVMNFWAIGYPAASPFSGAYMTACETSYAYDETFGSPNLFAYGCDQTGGTSGGPVIKMFGTGNYLMGVNAYRHTSQPKELVSPYVTSTIATSLFALARSWVW